MLRVKYFGLPLVDTLPRQEDAAFDNLDEQDENVTPKSSGLAIESSLNVGEFFVDVDITHYATHPGE